jgi:hypothetical protein
MAVNEYDALINSEPSVKPKEVNEYDSLIQRDAQRKDNAVKINLKSSLDKDPLQVFRGKQLSDTFKLPQPVVERNLTTIEANAKSRQWEETLKTSPTLKEFMTDTYFSGIAHQDTKLAEAEKVLRTTGFAAASKLRRENQDQRETEFNAWAKKPQAEWARSWGDVPKDLSYSVGQSFGSMGKGLVEATRLGYMPILKAINFPLVATGLTSPKVNKEYQDAFNKATDYLTGFSEFQASQKSTEMQAKLQALSKQSAFDIIKDVVTLNVDPALVVDLFAQSSAYLIPSAAAGRATPLVSTIYSSLSEGFDSAATAREEARAAGADQNEEDAAAVKALFISAPLAFLGNKVLKLGDIESKFFKTGKVGNAFATILKEGLGGMIEDASNTLGVNVAAVTGYEPERDVTQGVAKSAVLGFILEATQGLGMKGVSTALDVISNRVNKSEEDLLKVQTIQESLNVASESMVRNMDSNTFSQFAQSVVDDNEELPSEVFIDAKVFNQAMQDAGLDPNIIDGIQDNLNEAIATGADVSISFGELAAKLSNTEAEQVILQNMKLEQDGMTVTQLTEYASNIKTELEKEIVSAIADEQQRTDFETKADFVYEDIFNQLNQTGRYGTEANRLQAMLAKQYFATQALNDPQGRTPDQLYALAPLKIQGESIYTQGQVYEQGSLKTDTPEFKNWFGDSKVTDDAGQPLVVYHSTSKDAAKAIYKSGFDTNLSYDSAIWFTSDKGQIERGETGAAGQGETLDMYVSIKNPASRNEYDKYTIDQLIQQGYDGVMLEDDVGFAFESNQFKSVNNAGTFNPNDPNILRQDAQETTNIRARIPKFRGGTTLEKITKALKSLRSDSSQGIFYKEIAKYDTIEDAYENIFYHGTGGYIEGNFLKAGSALKKNSFRGGGYGSIQNSISLSSSKNVASDFTGDSRSGNVYPVVLKKGAKVENHPEWSDAMEVEDHLVDLWDRGIDAVKIGNWSDEFSEQEIVILNPRAIVLGKGELFQVFNKKRFEQPTVEDLKTMVLNYNEKSLTLQQDAQVQTDSKAFKDWFKKSVVVDENKKPLVVYHGTNATFDTFDYTKIGETGRLEGAGFYFTNNKDIATQYGEPMEVYLSLQKPMPYDTKPFNKATLTRLIKRIAEIEAETNGEDIANGFLSNFGDVSYDGLNSVIKEAVDITLDDESALDQISGFVGAGVEIEVVNKAVQEVTGYDGVVAKGLGNQGDGKDKVYVAFFREQVKSATGNVGAFDPNNPNIYQQDALGTFDPENFVITLKKGANLTTFAHELGHYFLEVNTILAGDPNADPQLLADVNTTMEWFGTDLATWRTMTLEQKRESHEKFARGWEAYLFKGEAPSAELKTVFQRFTSWMANAYRSLKEFLTNNNVDLPPEISQVFDRMLATQDQIEQAKKRRGLSALFNTADEGQMTDEEFLEYQDDLAKVTGDAIETMNKRSLADIKWLRRARSKAIREFQKEGEAIRREVQMEARREVMSQPIYQAWSFLTAREWGKVSKKDKPSKTLDPTTDSLFVAIQKLGGLNRALIQSEIGLDTVDMQKFPRTFSAKGGMSPDGMAEALSQYGYLNVDENGKYDVNDFHEAVTQELSGSPYYSNYYDYSRENQEIVIGEQVEMAKQLPAGRINLEEAKAIFGDRFEEVKAKMGKMLASDGLYSDAVAELYVDENGERVFGSGKDLILQLADVMPPSQAIQELTDKIVLERHGDLTSDKALQNAADEALHNEAMLRSAATEMKAITGMQGGYRELVRAAKDAAIQAINQVKVKDLRPSKYITAAVKAGKEADQAVKSKDLELAVQAKRKQLLNIAMAQRAYEVESEVRKAMEGFRKLNRADKVLAKTHDINLVDTARSILASFGLNASDPNTAMDNLSKVQTYNPDLYASLVPIVQGATVIAKNDQGEFIGYQQLTIDEFLGLRDTVKQLTHQARGEKTITVNGMKVELDQARQELIDQLAENNGQIIYDEIVRAPSKKDEFKVRMLSTKSVLSRMEHWVYMQDRGNFNGPFRTYMLQSIMNGITKYRIAKRDKYKQVKEIVDVKKQDKNFLIGEIYASEFKYIFKNKAELLGALQHIGNEGNKKKNLVGRGWAEMTMDADGNKFVDYSKWDAFMARMFDEGVITKEDMDVVQSIWDVLESIKPQVQQAHYELKGFYFDEVTAKEIVTPFGTYRGGYIPATPDSNANVNSQTRELMTTLEENFTFMMPSTPSGFTKARTEYNVPLTMDLRLSLQSIDKMLKFTYINPAVNDVNKLFGKHGGLADALFEFDRTTLPDLITPWLNRVVTQTSTEQYKSASGKWLGNALAFFTRNTGLSFMAGNIKNALEQYTGSYVARAEVETKYIRNAQAKYLMSPNETANFVAEQSEWMAVRLNNQLFDYMNEIENVLEEKTNLQKVQELSMRHGYILQRTVQNQLDLVVWLAAFEKGQETLSEEQAVEYADSVIRRTQSSLNPEDVSSFESGTAGWKAFTQFYNYFNNILNLSASKAVVITKTLGVKKGSGKLFALYFYTAMIPALVSGAIKRTLNWQWDDEDDDGYLDEFMDWFVGDQFRYMTAFIPFGGQIINTTLNRFNDNPMDDRVSFSPIISMVDTAIGAAPSAYKAMFEDGSIKKGLKDTLTVMSVLFGVPVSVLGRPAGYLADMSEGKVEPDNPLDFARGMVSGQGREEERQ